MKSIEIDKDFYTVILTEDEVSKLLDDLQFLEDAITVLLNSEVAKKDWDIPYSKKQYIAYLKEYFRKDLKYSDDAITEIFENY